MIDQHKKVSEVVTERSFLPDGKVQEVVIALCETPDKNESFAGTVWCSTHGETRVTDGRSTNSE